MNSKKRSVKYHASLFVLENPKKFLPKQSGDFGAKVLLPAFPRRKSTVRIFKWLLGKPIEAEARNGSSDFL